MLAVSSAPAALRPPRPYEAGAVQKIHRPASVDAAVRPDSQPEARLIAQQLSVAIVDAIEGRRNVRSLQRWTVPEVYRSLQAMVAAHPGRSSSLPALAMGTRVFCVDANTVEFASTVWDQSHAQAVAGRLVKVRSRWVIVALESHQPSGAAG